MRILAAMSGGVDSAVVAGLLAEAGHEVIGATLQLTRATAGAALRGTCCAGRDIHDARRVADHLGIPHYVIDAEERFRATVIDRFAAAYASGQTPVPCIACNQGVKFTDLLDLSRELGCEAMATGHYVRRLETDGGAELHRPRDAARDQSWFLFATTGAQLARLRFPLGEIETKAQVREQAARLGIRIADKPDSQDICFVSAAGPDADYADIVARSHPEALAPGDIVDADGTVLGTHQGVARYTVGQGRRLGSAAMREGERQAVRRIDPASRRIVVGPRRGAGSRAWRLGATNWLIPPPATPLACAVQLRSNEAPRRARLVATGPDTASLVLDEAALVAPGQAAVAYDGTRILGGGFVSSPAP